MNCEQVSRIIASKGPLSVEAVEHIRTCGSCSALAALDPRTEQAIIDRITADLGPVQPLQAAWTYMIATMVGVLFVASAGIAIMGVAGWTLDSAVQRTYFVSVLAAGVLVSAALLARLMIPGELLAFSPRAIITALAVSLGMGVLLYPLIHYDGFGRAVAACVAIGLTHAVLGCALAYWIVRRGAFLARVQTGATIGFLGGLAGLVVLFVFCPHRDLGHFALGHTSVPSIAALAGAACARGLAAVRR
jgi:hypothetical protein